MLPFALHYAYTRHNGGHSDPGGRREAPAWREPPNDRTAVKRPRRPFWLSRWAGGRPPEGRPPAQRETPFNNEAGSEWSRRSCRRGTGAVAPVAIFSVCFADTENLYGALLGAPSTPVPAIMLLAVKTARNRVAGRGSESPWRRRIPWARGKPAGNRRLPFSDRGFTAAVRMAQEAPPACWRCFRGRWPWRSMTARVRMTPNVCKGGIPLLGGAKKWCKEI
ncbi:hypothetical protein NDU88_006481 [Pleurodeles waltl]|uniref:Uncharacterized protein n=1 Tax=Pleurodeles waltl TaxID=8319 RepID=A0AAV7VM31_PLEWA|nr:hypothetical protein NDU88_006481 [Pleurodeles waltl]